MLFSEFSRDSTKKNVLLFVFAARKFANIRKKLSLAEKVKEYKRKKLEISYLCNVLHQIDMAKKKQKTDEKNPIIQEDC